MLNDRSGSPEKKSVSPRCGLSAHKDLFPPKLSHVHSRGIPVSLPRRLARCPRVQARISHPLIALNMYQQASWRAQLGRLSTFAAR